MSKVHEINKIKKSSDVRVRSFDFSINIINHLLDVPNKPIYWSLINQLTLSATSVGANLFEAKSSHSKKDFIRFYEIALKSANETEYWLLLFKESNLDFDSKKIEELINESTEIAKMIAAGIITLKNKR